MNKTSNKKTWESPELKKFNKMDLVKGGAANMNLEGGICYKMGS